MNTRKSSSARHDPALNKQLCFALYSIMIGINRVHRSLLKALNLTYSQYLVMLVLWGQDAQTVLKIDERLFLDSATLTLLLKWLEAAGLIERQRSAEGERQMIIPLAVADGTLERWAEKMPAYMAAAIECAPGKLEGLHTRLDALWGRLFKNAV